MDFEQMLREALQSEDSVCRYMEPMSSHTTFRIGGPAQFFVIPGNAEDLSAVLRLCARNSMPWKVLGNGSNLLVSDRGCDGVVISMEGKWSYGEADGAVLRAGSGMLLSRAASLALRESLAGMEFASGIPGTVGGALVMNAGAYGSEMKDILLSAKVMTPEGEVKTLQAPELKLGYRTSSIPGEGFIVLEAALSLTPGNRELIEAQMKELARRRREKQPLEYPSAGSTFKRPQGYFAGKLIEESGMRGFRLGGAQVSEKHCGFVINAGNATASDVMDLCRHVSRAVKEQFDVELEMEVRRWGEF